MHHAACHHRVLGQTTSARGVSVKGHLRAVVVGAGPTLWTRLAGHDRLNGDELARAYVIDARADVDDGASHLVAQYDGGLHSSQWMSVSEWDHLSASIVFVKVATADSGGGDLYFDLAGTRRWLRHLLDADIPRTVIDGSAHDVLP